jgi:hypothetical protein
MSDVVNRFSGANPGRDSIRPNAPPINGDILLLTQDIVDCVGRLRKTAIQAYTISDYWDIDVLSRYSSAEHDRPRIYVANPGWFNGELSIKCGAVVIDASHPRTYKHLDRLLENSCIADCPLQIIITPPLEEDRWQTLCSGNRVHPITWSWDPSSVRHLTSILDGNLGNASLSPPDRELYVCDDPEVDALLKSLHQHLCSAMQIANGVVGPSVGDAWGIYHRLRQLAVPLLDLEEHNRHSYGSITLGDRIVALQSRPPIGPSRLSHFFGSRWHDVCDSLALLHTVLLNRTEPCKFYGIASLVRRVVTELPGEQFRIIAPSEYEASQLSGMLTTLVDGFNDALLSGQASVTTVRAEPKLVAQDNCCRAILQGYRISATRSLDAYTMFPVHVVAYPYEVEVDRVIQDRVHQLSERLADDSTRRAVLDELRIQTRGETAPRAFTLPARSRIVYSSLNSDHVRLHQTVDLSEPEPIDFDELLFSYWDVRSDTQAAATSGTLHSSASSSNLVCITDSDGNQMTFPCGHMVDVFYPASGKQVKIAAGKLRKGMLAVVLVDGLLDDLYSRLLEAIHERRDPRSSIRLAYWTMAKHSLLKKHDLNRRRLYDVLRNKGLKVDYSAVVGWYSTGEDEIIAPLHKSDLSILAAETGMFGSRKDVEALFETIQCERNLRRQCGRLLRRLLTSLCGGQNFEGAMSGAQLLGTPVEEVAAAVSLREVVTVQHL